MLVVVPRVVEAAGVEVKIEDSTPEVRAVTTDRLIEDGTETADDPTVAADETLGALELTLNKEESLAVEPVVVEALKMLDPIDVPVLALTLVLSKSLSERLSEPLSFGVTVLVSTTVESEYGHVVTTKVCVVFVVCVSKNVVPREVHVVTYVVRRAVVVVNADELFAANDELHAVDPADSATSVLTKVSETCREVAGLVTTDVDGVPTGVDEPAEQPAVEQNTTTDVADDTTGTEDSGTADRLTTEETTEERTEAEEIELAASDRTAVETDTDDAGVTYDRTPDDSLASDTLLLSLETAYKLDELDGTGTFTLELATEELASGFTVVLETERLGTEDPTDAREPELCTAELYAGTELDTSEVVTKTELEVGTDDSEPCVETERGTDSELCVSVSTTVVSESVHVVTTKVFTMVVVLEDKKVLPPEVHVVTTVVLMAVVVVPVTAATEVLYLLLTARFGGMFIRWLYCTEDEGADVDDDNTESTTEDS